MNDIVLNFLNSKHKYSIKNKEIIFNKEKDIVEPFFIEDKKLKRNNFLNKIYSYFFEKKITDDKSIKKLEDNIIETFTFLKNENLIPVLCPSKINFRFIRDTYLEQKQHKEEQLKNKSTIDEKFEQYADSKLKDFTLNNESVINISTEHVKLFTKLNNELNGKFLKSLRNKFSTIPIISINNSNKIITELVILHELGHFVSTEKVRETLISRSHRDINKEINFPIVKKIINNEEKEINVNHILNLSRNILEGFSDCFSTYLTQQHYKNIDIINNYSKSRKETSVLSSNTIKHYDLNDIFDSISKLKHKHIELLIDDFFNIAINNSINITKKLIKEKPIFEQELKQQFEYYAKELNISLNQNKSLIDNIEEQLKKACLSNLNNSKQIILNIQEIRHKSLNNSNHLDIKP